MKYNIEVMCNLKVSFIVDTRATWNLYAGDGAHYRNKLLVQLLWGLHHSGGRGGTQTHKHTNKTRKLLKRPSKNIEINEMHDDARRAIIIITGEKFKYTYIYVLQDNYGVGRW